MSEKAIIYYAKFSVNLKEFVKLPKILKSNKNKKEGEHTQDKILESEFKSNPNPNRIA